MVSLLFKWSFFAFLFLSGTEHRSPVGSENSAAHPFYVSVTEFNLNASENNLEISCKLFADDFENNLRRQYKSKIDLTNPQDVKQVEKIVFDYLQKHLQLRINNNDAVLQFVGFEKEAEAAWCYLQVTGVKSLNKLEVRNTILYEAYDSQINIMHVMAAGQRKSAKVQQPEQTWTFQF
jgi:hypothetical protein